MQITKTINYLGTLLSLIASSSVWGSDLLEHYRSELIDNPIGVYESIDHVFFITEAECIEEKRSAGSLESKKAQAHFYQLLAQEVEKRVLSIEPSEWESLPIFEEIQYRQKAQRLKQSRVHYQLLSDSNLDNCVRRQVRASSIEAFNSQHITISNKDVAPLVGEAIAELVADKDYDKLAQQLNSPSLPEVSGLYRVLIQGEVTASNNDLADAVVGMDQYDINGVLSTAKLLGGRTLASSDKANPQASEYWLIKAENLFERGQSPVQIKRYLTLSLNADPRNANAWKTLSNLMRTIGQDDALWTARQYFLASGGSLNAWVYLYSALEVAHPDQANQLLKLLKQVANEWPLSHWEQNQIKG
ncbi:hypothetical protein L4D06_09555 [Enterovibrio makurazakiensis]|uniref:hypothetical protein n=1 Tax=Enterovibrio makurazakiensis TaxID=2910232 RepID=UPI003D1A09D0